MELQRLPGFRDFYPEDRAWLNYIIECWRTTAANFGFAEYDGPTLEPTDLYKKKSGEELKSQLFRFVDQGGRDICLRPEMTPTLARLVAARERDFKKPIKWFSISPFFRFEKPQKGRLREFYQINCDLIGDNSPAADAELISVAIHLLRGFGLTERDFSVRLSNRNLWSEFLKRHDVPVDRTAEFLGAGLEVPDDDVERRLRLAGEIIPSVRPNIGVGAWAMLGALFGFKAGNSLYVSPGILRVMDLPILIGEDRLFLIGGAAVMLALAVALLMPNVPQIFRYREYRRAPESSTWPQWRPGLAWALLSALAFAISLFGMWQRLEFLYFQF